MNPTEELVKFLVEWAKKNDYTFYVPEGSETIIYLNVDITRKEIYINGKFVDDAISPN